jgi:hypothetical protein
MARKHRHRGHIRLRRDRDASSPNQSLLAAMKNEKPAPLNPDDIELHPDAWDRFVDAVKRVARHPPVEKSKPQAKWFLRKAAFQGGH